MKKFLTVLLALSVVFTYSFSAVGSVFAATPSEASKAAAEAKAEAKTVADNAYKTLAFADGNLAFINGTACDATSTISKTAVDQAAADLLAEIYNEIQKAADATVTGATGVQTISEVKAAYYADEDVYLGKLFDKDATSKKKYLCKSLCKAGSNRKG